MPTLGEIGKVVVLAAVGATVSYWVNRAFRENEKR